MSVPIAKERYWTAERFLSVCLSVCLCVFPSQMLFAIRFHIDENDKRIEGNKFVLKPFLFIFVS